MINSNVVITKTKNQLIDKADNLALFLADVEKKAFRMAMLATRNEADALDLVQDTMIKLVSHYRDKPQNEWRPLFYRILQNRMMDWYRQQKLRKLFFFWQQHDNNSEQTLDIPDNTSASPEEASYKNEQTKSALLLLQQLPLKQQQCFLLRSWEGMSVKETAKIMQCSEGSVKTHYHRACKKLKPLLDLNNES